MITFLKKKGQDQAEQYMDLEEKLIALRQAKDAEVCCTLLFAIFPWLLNFWVSSCFFFFVHYLMQLHCSSHLGIGYVVRVVNLVCITSFHCSLILHC